MDRPQRYALLVGIDLYLKNGTNRRRDEAIHHLKGCVNDINAVKTVLQDRFQVEEPVVLTSSLDATSTGRYQQPQESPDVLPTFDNIKREFDTVTEKANPGDIFFFQYSGHGGRLPRIQGSPAGRDRDPSLLTADFCLNKPAVRGWELNEWLKRLNEKGVQIIVVLDSCYSGGSWRGDHLGRTPVDWEEDLESLGEEEVQPAAEPTMEPSADAIVPSYRNSELEKCWSINPDDFTLMAACKSGEVAKEIKVNARSHGVFTYTLVKLLEQIQPDITPSTYCVLRDKIAERLESHNQNPEVFGRDRLGFFDNYEPFLFNPLVSKVEGNDIVIPMGKIHGVHPGTEFAQVPLFHKAVFKVNKIKDWECRATLTSGLPSSSQCSIEVVPLKWGLGGATFRVLVDGSLGDEFQEAIYKRLDNLLAGPIEVEEFHGSSPDNELFKLTRRGLDGVEISGPPSLIGYEGPLRCLELKGTSTSQLAARSAVALAHLVRFGQIFFDLPKDACEDTAPFTSSLEKVNSVGDSKVRMKFVFTNTSESDLYLTVLSLHPGFGVRQIYPGSKSREPVRKGNSVSFTMQITFPKELRTNEDAGPVSHRDVIRVIVTRGEDVPWRCLELPDIWQVDQVESKAQHGSDRNVEIADDDFSWWIKDHRVDSVPF